METVSFLLPSSLFISLGLLMNETFVVFFCHRLFKRQENSLQLMDDELHLDVGHVEGRNKRKDREGESEIINVKDKNKK